MNLEKGRAHETRAPPPRENAILHSFTRFLGEKGVRLNELKRARILQFRDCAEYRFVYALRHSSKKIISSLTLLSLPISYSNLFIIFFSNPFTRSRYTIEYIQTNVVQKYLIFKNISERRRFFQSQRIIRIHLR